MDFWKPPAGRDDEPHGRANKPKPSLLGDLAQFAKEEAISEAVDKLSGGWLSYEPDDDEEERNNKRSDRSVRQESFTERLERGLSEIMPQADPSAQPPPPPPAPETAAVPMPLPEATPVPAPLLRPAHRLPARGPGGFGRKGL